MLEQIELAGREPATDRGGQLSTSEHRVVVAFAHGPEKFVMRYEHPTAEGADSLGTNPWIDFDGEAPRLLPSVH
ncbi:hypothetical protein LWC34_05860 [Kibdelosporangium philippinense]|uniref:Uncharacterized protein n=1 Tax=Kibdelosporangium philippinense TaxID=211113 RepID=A0ABS8Z711_9PSEU|nr:hypothetical protein [Kibdelosporangium philippinense]MCE7002358.1 hypothetical protein [Kibdelosporangium philippinense]